MQEGEELPERATVSDNTVLLTIPNFGTDAAGRYYCSAIQNNEAVRQSIIDLVFLRKFCFVFVFVFSVCVSVNVSVFICAIESLNSPCIYRRFVLFVCAEFSILF